MGAHFEAFDEGVLVAPLNARYTQVGFNFISVQVCSAMHRRLKFGLSTGPMTWYDPDTQKEILAGIASLHFGCGRENLPGIYARATSALDWVKGLGVDPEMGQAYNVCPPCVGPFCIFSG